MKTRISFLSSRGLYHVHHDKVRSHVSAVTALPTREPHAVPVGVRPLQGEDGFPVPLGHALHTLHLVDDQALPAHAGEGRVPLEELLVGRDADVEAVGLGPLLQHTKDTATLLSCLCPRDTAAHLAALSCTLST